jgi:hypothetical protein
MTMTLIPNDILFSVGLATGRLGIRSNIAN